MKNDATKDILRLIGVFTPLCEEDLGTLASIAKVKSLSKNAILHYEGEHIPYACLLARGWVELYKMDQNDNELFLCYVDSRACGVRLINAFGTFEPYEAAANVRAVEESTIVLLDLVGLRELIMSRLAISNAFLSEYMDKVLVFKNFINFKEVYDSTSRVACVLRTQLDRFNQSQRQTIARELNIKLETLSRILQKMIQQGLIAKDSRGEIQIKDVKRFEELYGDVSSCMLKVKNMEHLSSISQE